MSENNPATGGTAPGGASGNTTAGGGSGQTQPTRALFLGQLFPAPLDENGNVVQPKKGEGPGTPQFVTVIYGYDKTTDGANLHAQVDKVLGQPYFKAYIYPITDQNEDKALDLGGGGGEGKAVLGGAPGSIIYLGQISAILPDSGNKGGGTPPAPGSGTPSAPGGGGGTPTG